MSEELEGWIKHVETLDFQKFWKELTEAFPREEGWDLDPNFIWINDDEEIGNLWYIHVNVKTDGWSEMLAEEGDFDELERLIAFAKKWGHTFWYEFDSHVIERYQKEPFTKKMELKPDSEILFTLNTTCRRFV